MQPWSPAGAPASNRRAVTAGLALAAALTVPLVVAACGGEQPDDRAAIQPVGGPVSELREPPTPPGDTARAGTAAPAVAAEPTPEGAPSDVAPAGEDETRSLVQSVLDRYDAALTAVAADPLAATPGHPTRSAWHSTVVEGSSFSIAMLAELADRATHESTVVRPGPDGMSYRHHVLSAVADGAAVSFTWCGHSPGVGVDIATGEVVDDGVALSHGTGELHHDGSQWRLLTLDAFDVEVAAAGTPDPCPAEAAGR